MSDIQWSTLMGPSPIPPKQSQNHYPDSIGDSAHGHDDRNQGP